MNQPERIPLPQALPQAQVIPEGTGLVEWVDCLGVKKDNNGHRLDALLEPERVQLVTFANRVREVCCKYKYESGGGQSYCVAGEKIAGCKFAWENPEQ